MAVINSTNFPYDLTNVTRSGNILDFIVETNKLVGQTFMLGMLIVGFVVLFVSMRSAGNKDALLTSSFIIAVMSIFFRTLEFITTANVVSIIVVFVLIFVITVLRKE